jgi:hypothetical protein
VVVPELSVGDQVEGVFAEEHLAFDFADQLDESYPRTAPRRVDRLAMNSMFRTTVRPRTA